LGGSGRPFPPIPDFLEEEAEDETYASQHPRSQPEHPEAQPSHVFEQVALARPRRAGNIFDYSRLRGAEVYRLLAGVAGFLVPIGSSGTLFAVIDSAARPTIACRYG